MEKLKDIRYIKLSLSSYNYHRFKEYLDKHSKVAVARRINKEWHILYESDMLSLVNYVVWFDENQGKFKFQYKGKFCMKFKDKSIHFLIEDDYVTLY